LRQNRHFHSALILLGHEFIELKNFPAALETYRQAVDVNPSDYRAWYGLGQAYELNRMFYYSLHYYNKAKSLRPYDARMWCALGGSYENIEMNHLAIKCFERAEANDDKEGIAVIKLARLFEKAKDKENAAKYYRKHLERRHREGLILLKVSFSGEPGQDDDTFEGEPSAPKQEDQDALKFLVTYMRDEGRLDEAQAYAENLHRIAGPHDPEAHALLKEIQGKKNARDSKRPFNRNYS
jgi:anaphase-promoting complex subunit 8